MLSPRELVLKTLAFENPERVPRQLWYLPWASLHFPEELSRIREEFPDDIVVAAYDGMKSAEGFQSGGKKPVSTGDVRGRLPAGDVYETGEYMDVWGCTFTNLHRGVIGEVKQPPITGENWEEKGTFRLPEECLSIDIEAVNRFCRSTDRFVLAGDWARPFERLQFLRGTAQFFMDLILKPDGMGEVVKAVHEYYCRLLTGWAKTDVDALWFMDDWGAQNALLVRPDTWVELFKPMYADYIDIAHGNGKKIFMHSDGYILEIIPHLIDMGLDALNSQLFCMGVETLSRYSGRITFWGEIDRQHLLPAGTTGQVTQAVRRVKDNLWRGGGCIAQCEFGAGANPDNVRAVFKAWNSLV